jgi:ATP-dependent helicase/nuclease subunit A
VAILADTTTPPAGAHAPRLLAVPRPRAAPDAPPCLVWPGPKRDDVEAVAAARALAQAEAEDEHRRLLYVAMTRAAERLIVCGCQGKQRRPAGCWYDLVLEGLTGKPGFEEIGEGDARAWHYRVVPDAGAASAGPHPRAAARAHDEPAWLTTPFARETARTVTLTPSAAHEETAAPRRRPSGGQDRRRAIERGILVHRLMQSLPEIAASERAAAARRYIERAGAAFAGAEQDRLVAGVLGLLADARFAPLFAAGSRAEVPIVGRLHRAGRPDVLVSGQIDRLVVTADAVLIADYKTNQAVPDTPQAAPQAYLEQLALYRAVLGKVYPDRAVRAALVWTEGPEWMEFSSAHLDAALARVTSA